MTDYIPEYKCKKYRKSQNMWIEQLLLKNKKIQERLDRIENYLGLEHLPDDIINTSTDD